MKQIMSEQEQRSLKRMQGRERAIHALLYVAYKGEVVSRKLPLRAAPKLPRSLADTIQAKRAS